MILDDEESIRFSLSEILGRKGYRVEAHADPFRALEALPTFQPQIVVADYALPKMDGLEFMTKVLKKVPETVVIFMTAYGTEELAVEAMKLGAYDYFRKPFNNDAVLVSIGKARERLQLVEENRRLKEEAQGAGEGFKAFVGESPEIREIFAMVDRIADTGVTVLIQGESGTGKELVAGAIHRRSGRATRPFVRLNCAAIPESLIESELFGSAPGAFTGAGKGRAGKFEAADGGTLFLDEIGDMSPATQTKVLRVLQEGEVERIGSNQVRKVDVRIIAATHQDLEARVQRGDFREDLFYRLNVVNLRVPALRDRGGDLDLLIAHFQEHYAEKFEVEAPALDDAARARFADHRWPGNVRELENILARAVLLGSYDGLPPTPREEGSAPATAMAPVAEAAPASAQPEEEGELSLEGLISQDLPYKEAKRLLIEDFERRYLGRQLERTDGNVSKAARLSGMARKNFWTKMQRIGLGSSRGEEESE
jgi:two-component system response regulator HydG